MSTKTTQKTTYLTALTAAMVVLSVILGIFAGYNRLGWLGLPTGMAGEHGALMVGSFLGTLIILERTVAAQNKWFLFIPLLNACSLPLFLFGFPGLALLALVGGSIGLCFIYLHIIDRQGELFIYVMLGGSVCWLIGNLLAWQYHFFPQALPWWISFLLLTITGERLELGKSLTVKQWQKLLLISLLVVFVIAAGTFYHGWGQMIAGLALFFTALWLLKFDLIWIGVKEKGLNRFSNFMLGLGYLWLAVCGICMMLSVNIPIAYDVLVHSFFLGFTFSMIFAHGPVILPGIAKLPFQPFSHGLYIWGILLHISLLLRICGSLHGIYPLKFWSGIFNGVFIAAYFLNIAYQLVKMKKGMVVKKDMLSLFS